MDDLVTERLVLHPLSAAEAERLVARQQDPADRWAPGYPADGDVAGARRFLTTCAETGDPGPFCCYEIRQRGHVRAAGGPEIDGRAVGGVGFHGPADENDTVTIGYGLIPAARGHGYATEALRAVLALARTHGAARVLGDADLGNIASQRVMEAAGMRLLATTDKLKFYEISWQA